MDATHHKSRPGPGRPRAYDERAALDAALQVFWTKGFEATKLDELTAAMGLSRSSFYAGFGSKEQVLLAALSAYSETALAALAELAHKPEGDAVPAMLSALADPKGGPRGCMLVNCITELAPHNAEVAAAISTGSNGCSPRRCARKIRIPLPTGPGRFRLSPSERSPCASRGLDRRRFPPFSPRRRHCLRRQADFERTFFDYFWTI